MYTYSYLFPSICVYLSICIYICKYIYIGGGRPRRPMGSQPSRSMTTAAPAALIASAASCALALSGVGISFRWTQIM